ncbi:MAG: alpha-glucuronidase [Anaerolineae bacterium]|nr:alpha-glucuronidase [Anaerolineae bacterium]NUQ04058.1 alpha-glucuronidase [Anaerolineae bacterium]
MPLQTLSSEDGYELWLRYRLMDDPILLTDYRSALQRLVMRVDSATLEAARDELMLALPQLLGQAASLGGEAGPGALFCGRLDQSPPAFAALAADADLDDEGFLLLKTDEQGAVLLARRDIGVLYGVFHLLRLLQTHQPLDSLNVTAAPRTRLRMLNHWDNIDRTIERGYAGFSLWDWHKLPHYVDPRCRDYARANASLGINAASLTNVNASALILQETYLHKLAAIADVFRPYGIRIFLTARFNAPMTLGGLTTADPLNPQVAAWWRRKVDEIYTILPDFGGFVVKANSEGEPGPHDYGRSHADGANMLADALAAHGGLVHWRAFVYDPNVPQDRVMQANSQLAPLDGQFRSNVLLQVKNGPLDYQPREPFHSLFGAMPKTVLTMEFQITQEYLGCATHLAYLAPLFKEVLDADTYCQGEGSTVARIVDGSLDGHRLSGMAGVSNIGTDRNWCGHPFAAANWYAFGRLAWDHTLSAEQIADEWLRMTFSNQPAFLEKALDIMMQSREAVVEYMMPLGLHHLFEADHHYGPGPWVDAARVGRADWSSVYYHQADSEGIGFDRTRTGSSAVSLYHSPYRELLENVETCPENLLLWFHHVRWDRRMKSGRTLWDELCFMYNRGVERVRQMQTDWDSLADPIDLARFEQVRALLRVQEREARWWRDACLLYFQSFSGKPIPAAYEQPEHTLEYYRGIRHYYVPGIRERRFG